MKSTMRWVPAALAAAALVFTGTAAQTQDAAGFQDGVLTVTLSEWTFGFRTIEATGGTVRVVVRNSGDRFHNLTITLGGQRVHETADVGGGQATEFTIELAPGVYALYCGIGSHRDAGMSATLTVTGGGGA